MSIRSRTPFVTLFLIVANIVAAFFVLIRPDIIESSGFKASEPSIVNVFAAMFLHANAIHLLGNMVFLAAVGAAVEIATGSIRFLAVYLFSGICGAGVFWLSVRHNVDVPPLVGASGSIAGCAVYYSLRYTKFRVPLAPKASATVAIVTFAWLLMQAIGAIVRIGEPLHASGFLAHLGGALGGMILSFLFRAPDLGSQKLGHQVYEALNDHGPVAQIAHLKGHLADHPEDVAMHLKLAGEYQEMGDTKDEVATLKSILFQLSGDKADEAVSRLVDLKQLGDIAPIRRRQLADKLSNPVAAKVLWSIADLPKNEPQRPEALLELVGRLKEDSPEESARALEILKTDYPSHSAMEIAKKRGWLG